MDIPPDKNKATESASLDALVEAYQELRNNTWSTNKIRNYHRALLNAAKIAALKEMDRNAMSKHYRKDET